VATRNTGGILVFDLPNLPVMGGGNVIVANNLVIANDTPNFAPPGNIVAGVRRGTGIMVMANDKVLIEDNILSRNPTAPIMVIAYTQEFEDERYNPLPRDVVVGENRYDGGGYDPQLEGADMLLAAFGGELPPVLWDGLGSLSAVEGTAGWNLNLTEAGKGLGAAQPGPLAVGTPGQPFDRSGIGAPAALEQRLGG
ncbi:MAG: hypothetical protein CL948_03340, partial [Erythrobacter sp.]|nr:hypothetical protein [Erythrobacter sp.]